MLREDTTSGEVCERNTANDDVTRDRICTHSHACCAYVASASLNRC